MRICAVALAWAVGCLFVSYSATAQVFWDIDFDSSTDLSSEGYTAQGDGIGVTCLSTNTGDPSHLNVLRCSVDSSACTSWCYGAWRGALVRKTVPTYDPEHTFLTFDLLVNQLKPVHIQIAYASVPPAFDVRGLQIDVQPTVAGSFQRFTMPIAAFQVASVLGSPPNDPATLEFGIRGDAAHPDTTWPFMATNFFEIDNILYTMSPPLTIANSNNVAILSWPTNAIGFRLQQNSVFTTSNWTFVTNMPAGVNDQNQVLVPPVVGQNFYRLIGP